MPDQGPVPAPSGLVVEPIRVLVVDDHALFRRGLQMVLEQEPDICLLYTSPSPRDS